MCVYGSAAASLPGQPAEVQDEGWNRMTTAPGLLFSGTLKATAWPRLKIFHDDLVHFVPELERTEVLSCEPWTAP